MAKTQQQQLYEAKTAVKDFMEESNLPAQAIARMGEMAVACLKDQTLYPMFRQQLMATGAFEETDLPVRFNPSILGIIATMGKIADQMSNAVEMGA
jgi:hypothetical protein